MDLPAGLALLLVSVAATLGLTRLVTPSGAVDLVGPVLAATVVGHVSMAGAHRFGWRALPSLCGAAAAVVIVVVWSALPGTTWWGVPAGATLQGLFEGLRTGASVAARTSSPVPVGSGVVVLVSLASGGVAIAGRWAWTVRDRVNRRRPPVLPALVPSFAAFCYTSLLSADRARVPAAVAYVVTALTFLLLATRHERPREPRSGGGWAGAVALACVAAAGALVTLQVPAVADVTLTAFVGHGGASPTIGPVTSLDLEVDVAAVLASGSQQVMFRATVNQPTYWQVATLADDDHGEWLPGPAAARVGGRPSAGALRTPPDLPQPPPRTLLRGQVHLVDFRAPLLPVPSTVGSVAPVNGPAARLLTGIGAQVLGGAPPKGYRYRFTAAASPTVVSGFGLAPLLAGGSWSSLAVPGAASYLRLPSEPRAVARLAQIFELPGATPAQTAYAIERYFTSGRFTYTLHPPPPGRHPLSQFLFRTRQGFCQQFATAFAVLARLDHLPTRLVVGFTPGRWAGSGSTYTVTAADAHVWPQVYLGPTVGWVDFEPTPGNGSGTGARPGPLAPSFSVPNATAPVDSTPTTAGGSSLATRGNRGPSRPTGKGLAGQAPRAAGEPLLPLVAGGLTALVFVGVALALGRRRRREPGRRSRLGAPLRWRPWPLDKTGGDGLVTSRRARLDPRPHGLAGAAGPDPASATVGACWRRAERRLERAGLGRLPTETLREHRCRLEVVLGDEAPEVVAAYTRLVELTECAAYGVDRLSVEEADEAERLLEVLLASPLRRRPGVTMAAVHR